MEFLSFHSAVNKVLHREIPNSCFNLVGGLGHQGMVEEGEAFFVCRLDSSNGLSDSCVNIPPMSRRIPTGFSQIHSVDSDPIIHLILPPSSCFLRLHEPHVISKFPEHLHPFFLGVLSQTVCCLSVHVRHADLVWDMPIHLYHCFFDPGAPIRNDTRKPITLFIQCFQIFKDQGSILFWHERRMENEFGSGLSVEHEADSFPEPSAVKNEVGLSVLMQFWQEQTRRLDRQKTGELLLQIPKGIATPSTNRCIRCTIKHVLFKIPSKSSCSPMLFLKRSKGFVTRETPISFRGCGTLPPADTPTTTGWAKNRTVGISVHISNTNTNERLLKQEEVTFLPTI